MGDRKNAWAAHFVVLAPLFVGVIGLIGVLAEGNDVAFNRQFQPHPDNNAWSYVRLRRGQESEWRSLSARYKTTPICVSWMIPSKSRPDGAYLQIEDSNGRVGRPSGEVRSYVQGNTRFVTKYRFKAVKETTILMAAVDANRFACGYQLYNLSNPTVRGDSKGLPVSFLKRVEFITASPTERRRKGCQYWSGRTDCGKSAAKVKEIAKVRPSAKGSEQAKSTGQSRNSSVASPEKTENSLRLSRDVRRRIQRALTRAGFDTKGIDGVFGPATRKALSSWQAARGFSETGYLTKMQFRQLDASLPTIQPRSATPAKSSAPTGRYIDKNGCMREANGQIVRGYKKECY